MSSALRAVRSDDPDARFVVGERVDDRVQIAGRPARLGERSGHLDAVERLDREMLGAGVHHEGEQTVPRPRPGRCAHLVSEGERRRVAMVTVRDQERLLGEPVGDRHVRRDRPASVGHALLVHELGFGGARRHVVEQVLERGARACHGAVDGGEVGVCGSEQPQAVLDRSGHRLLVRHDVAAPVLELHGAEDTSDGVGHRRRHLVGEERGRRADEHALIDPPTQERSRVEVAVLAVIDPQVDLHDAERLRAVLPPPRLADNVVRRRGHAIERAGDRDVVDQGFEREDARHDPCIAARASRRPDDLDRP